MEMGIKLRKFMKKTDVMIHEYQKHDTNFYFIDWISMEFVVIKEKCFSIRFFQRGQFFFLKFLPIQIFTYINNPTNLCPLRCHY